jgi:hypothetical protein
MTDYEKVLEYLRQRCLEVRGEWDGDESGKREDQANAAEELLKLLLEVDSLVRELDL